MQRMTTLFQWRTALTICWHLSATAFRASCISTSRAVMDLASEEVWGQSQRGRRRLRNGFKQTAFCRTRTESRREASLKKSSKSRQAAIQSGAGEERCSSCSPLCVKTPACLEAQLKVTKRNKSPIFLLIKKTVIHSQAILLFAQSICRYC